MNPLPRKVMDCLFQDAMERDLTTRRRAVLMGILWNERFLTRMQLMLRVEYRVGQGCFGVAAWQDTFSGICGWSKRHLPLRGWN